MSESPEIIDYGSANLDLPEIGYQEVTERLKVLGDLLDKARALVPISYVDEEPHPAEKCVSSLLMAIASVAEYSSCLCVDIEPTQEQ